MSPQDVMLRRTGWQHYLDDAAQVGAQVSAWIPAHTRHAHGCRLRQPLAHLRKCPATLHFALIRAPKNEPLGMAQSDAVSATWASMTARRNAYELSDSQVSTPLAVVQHFWDITKLYRDRLGSVLDMGAGDCRFATAGAFDKYTGVEIDERRVARAAASPTVKIIRGCVFRHSASGYDACIGNPPYVRHHDLEPPWKERTARRLEHQLGISLNRNSNLYLYFLCLGLLKTHDAGLVALIIPYEWVSRPSARPIREYIAAQRWSASVYRFQFPIFDGVLTTASISIIDKSNDNGRWHFYDLSKSYDVIPRTGPAKARSGVLPYAPRGRAWALRGLSPGSQQIFTLSDGERIHYGLTKRDVLPCVTTLRHVPPTLKTLTRAAFDKYFVRSGQKCWLIRSFAPRLSQRMLSYLESIPEASRDNYTCNSRRPWYRFRAHPIPQLLLASGFTAHGPKVLINSMKATAVGAVFGLHSRYRLPLRKVQDHLIRLNFERRVIAHAKSLKKVEVNQVNAVLNDLVGRERCDAGKANR